MFDQLRERSRPKTRDGAATGIHRQMIAGALVEPAWRHHPGVFVGKIALLRFRDRRLIPRMAAINRVAERIVLDEDFAVITPVIVIRANQAGCECRD